MRFLRKHGLGIMLVIILMLPIVIGILIANGCRKTEVKFVEVEVEKTIEVPVMVEPERKYFDVKLSNEIQDFIFDECEKRNIAPALVVAVIEHESRYNINAIGDGGKSFGLMQIKKNRHLQRMQKLGCDNLLNPTQNIEVGIDYLDELSAESDNIFWVLMAYNGGSSYADKNIKKGNISNYAKEVIARAYELESTL